MHGRLLMFMIVVAGVLASTASAQVAVRCESSDERYQECAVSGGGVVALTRQLSDASCVEGRSWGVRNGRIWVDAGCRGEFTLASSPAVTFVASPQTFLCQSNNERRETCRADTRYGVALLRQVSEAPCVRDRTWGVGPEGVWVKDGCRGEFALGTTHVAQMTGGSGTRQAVVVATPSFQPSLVCESVNNSRRHCRTSTSGGVTLVQQMSDNRCELGRTWGVDADGIWVSGGCRASFAVGVVPMISATVEPVVVTQPVVVRQPVVVAQPVGAPLTVRPSVICESVNNGRSHCRIETSGGISLLRQFSDNACVRDRTWGVDRDGVWVTGGCRAEFTAGMHGATVVTVPAEPLVPTLVCESIDGRRNHCPADTSLGVTLLRQVSESNCVLNRTWGVDRDGVWVSGGCRAEFVHGGGARFDVSNAPDSARILCESKDGQRTVCPADTRMGVAVVRQISDSKCVLNSTWGFDTHGIWVTAGCRAEFVMRR